MKKLFPVTKTLAFRLMPVGATRQRMEDANFFKKAEELEKHYANFKQAADRLHRDFIEKVLSQYRLPYLSEGAKSSIQEYAEIFFDTTLSDTEKAKALLPIEKALKENIEKAFKAEVNKDGESILKDMASKELLIKLLPAMELSSEERLAVEELSAYTTYTRSYFEKRDAIYSAKEEGHTIPNRIVEDNLPLHLGNVRIAENIPEEIFEAVNADKELAHFIKSLQAYYIQDVFSVSMYSLLLSQSAIDTYNTLIGGYTKEGEKKVKGLNEYINEYNQANKTRISCFKQLKKQILTQRETPSWIPDTVSKDEEVIEIVNNLSAKEDSLALKTDPGTWDLNKIYVRSEKLADFSHCVFSDWKKAEIAIREKIQASTPQKKKEGLKGYNKRIDMYYKAKKTFSLQYILDAVQVHEKDDMTNEERAMLLKSTICIPMLKALSSAKDAYTEIKKCLSKGKLTQKLGQNGPEGKLGAGEQVKIMLDKLKEATSVIYPFTDGRGTLETDDVFYAGFYGPLKEFVSELNPTYDSVRNYLTKKAYSGKKIQMTFDNPKLLDGWDKNKLSDNRSLIFKDGEKIYLGILPPESRNLFNGEIPFDGETIERGEVKFFSNPHMTLPHVAFPKTGKPPVPLTPLAANYKEGRIELKDLTKNQVAHMVDFFKEVIKTKEDWKVYNFKFKPSNEYKTVNDFYIDVANQGYVMRLIPTSRSFIDVAVEEGALYLFEISCQDMLEGHHGKDGTYKTILFEALSGKPESKVRLCGGGEIYYRKASLTRNITHPAGVPIPNKNPDNPRPTRILKYDLIKDRRYTEERFAFHIPVKIYPDADKKGNEKVNARIREIIRQNPGMYVLGINRGERNLLSIALTAPDGRIIEQRNLNVFEGFDYRRALSEREKERKDNKRNWEGIRQIKDLKAGYLSLAVGEIAKLVRKYNCIVALERLDADFKNNRNSFEVNIYRQFERDLIGRLGLLTSKNDHNDLEQALQITDPGKNEEDRTKFPQNGAVLLINPSYITMTDPETGFVNRLDTRYSSVAESEKLIENMESFHFDKKNGRFSFTFDYGKVAPARSLSQNRKRWTIETYGERVENIRDFEENPKGNWRDVVTDLTVEMKKLLDDNDVAWGDGAELKTRLHGKSSDFWKELLHLLYLTTKNANWYTDRREFRLIGCTRDDKGRFYDTRTALQSRPMDADVNAAWNLARKAHLILNNIRNFELGVTLNEDGKLAKTPSVVISDEAWFASVQNTK